MRGMGDGARDRVQGCIQLTPDLGMREDMDLPVLQPGRGIKYAYKTGIA